MLRISIVLISTFLLAACTSTSETPLSANVWQISAEGRGSLGARRVNNQLLVRAAELTIENGFDSFFLSAPESRDQILNLGNTPVTATTSARISGNSIYGTTDYTGGDPILMRIKSSTVLVAMFRADDPQAENALDARQILERYGD